VLHADEIDFASLATGTYTLNSYFNGSDDYYTSLGTFTLKVPEPSANLLRFVALGLVIGVASFGRRSSRTRVRSPKKRPPGTRTIPGG
jgi:hypothetical protein